MFVCSRRYIFIKVGFKDCDDRESYQFMCACFGGKIHDSVETCFFTPLLGAHSNAG
jgi:hypothetical protein